MKAETSIVNGIYICGTNKYLRLFNPKAAANFVAGKSQLLGRAYFTLFGKKIL